MKKEDRRRACESLQEIETDLTYWIVESYQKQEIDDMISVLELMRPFLDINKEICSDNMK